MQKRTLLMAIVLGLLGADFVYLFSSNVEQQQQRRPPPPEVKVQAGQTIDVSITLVTPDAVQLACAGTEEVAGRRCAFEAPGKPWRNPDGTKPDASKVLAPYKTTNDVMFLVADLWGEPKLKERLAIDPPTPGGEHLRFVAHCKFKAEGQMQSFQVRWFLNGTWYPATNVWSGPLSGCSLSDP